MILENQIEPGIYMTDVEISALKTNYDVLNLHKFENLLTKYMKKYGEIIGVSSPLTNIGSLGSRFAFHIEDMLMNAITVLLYGASKIWYTIPPNEASKFEDLQKNNNEWPCYSCDSPLRHKSNLFSLEFIRENKITINRVVQNAREIVIVHPNAYHGGMNLGYNFAEGINFGYQSWIPYGKQFTSCKW